MNIKKWVIFLSILVITSFIHFVSAQENFAATTKYISQHYNITNNVPTKQIWSPSTSSGQAGDELLLATVEGSTPLPQQGLYRLRGPEPPPVVPEAVIYYVHTDHLSGSNAITEANGQLEELTDYYPFF